MTARESQGRLIDLHGWFNRLAAGLTLSMCAAAMLPGCVPLFAATTLYNRVDLTDVPPGTIRNDVVAKFGQPDSTSYLQGKQVDLYGSDNLGPKRGERAGYIAGFIVYDVATLGIMELPAAARLVTHPKNVVYAVTCSPDGKVETVK